MRLKNAFFTTVLALAFYSPINAQHDCPAIPAQMEWDTNCFIPSNVPDDVSKGTGLWLPEAFFHNKYNGATGQAARIPTNRAHWAIGIAHAWNYSRNIIKNQFHPKMSYWMATVVQESQWGCDAGAVWPGPNVGSPVGIAVPPVGTDGCYQIEGVTNGSAYGALLQYYPMRFRFNEHPNLIGGDNFVTSALTKAYYDIYTDRIAEYRWGWDYMASINNTCEPYAYEKGSASAYNGGIFAFTGAAGFFDRTEDANCYWTGLPASTAGYAQDIGDMISVLENNAAYPVATFSPLGAGSVFEGYYNGSITWADMIQYFDDIDDMYWEINFATQVIPNVTAAWNAIAGSTATPINFQDLGPVVDAIILSLPREDAMAPALSNDGSPMGPNGVNCSGNNVPFSHIEPQGPTTFCEGLSLDLNAIIDGGGGPTPTYRWREGSLANPVIGTGATLTVSPTAGNYTYWLEVCNGTDCYPACCEIPVTVLNCGGCGMTAVTTSNNTPCKGMPAGSIDVTIGNNASADYEVRYTGITSNGNVAGSVLSTATNVNLPNLIDGVYNIIVVDRTDTTCKAYSNVTVNFTTLINEHIDASLDGIAGCVADVSAELVELPAPCQFQVRAYAPLLNWPAAGDTTPNMFANWENIIVIPSGGGAQQSWVTDPNYQYGAQPWETAHAIILDFVMNTNDTIEFWTMVTATPGATQLNHIHFELWDETNTRVHTAFSPAGSATQGNPAIAPVRGSYVVTCPNTPPNYNFSWSPAITNEVTTATTTAGDAAQITTPRVFTVTATNVANPQCILQDTITVPGDPGCGVSCNDPMVASISPSAPPPQCGGNVLLTASETGTAPAGGFEYEFFRGAVSVQGPGAINTYNAGVSGSYTVVVTDPADPATCSSTSAAVNVTIDQATTITVQPADSTECDGGDVSFEVTATGTGLTYQWYKDAVLLGGETGATINLTGIGAGDAGDYEVVVSTSGSCPDVTSNIATLTVNTVAAPTAGNNGPICEGQQLDLTASNIGGATYSWTGPLAYTSGTQNPTVSASATAGMAGAYSVTATVGGCTSPAGVTSVTINAAPTAPTAGNNGPICEGQQLDLTASNIAGATYSWTGPLAYINGTQNPTVSASATAGMAGAYSVTATVAGCTGPAGVTNVTVNALPAAPTAGNNGPICEGQQLDLTASNIAGATYSWTGPLAYTNGTQNPTVSASATAGMAGMYSVTATVAGCTGPAGNTNVTVNAAPAAPTAGNNGPVCEGAQLDLTASNIAGATYSWTGPLAYTNGTQNPTVSTNATAGMAGAYSVTATVAGCTGPAGVTNVTVNALPTASISGTASICDDGATTAPLTITFTGSGPFNIDLDTAGGTHTSLVGVNSPHVMNVSADQTYTISNLTDANCTGTSTTGSATISYLDDVVATTSLECDDINPALAIDEFQIRVTVTQGDVPSINISELTAHGVIFTDQGGGVWLSNAVNEANTVDINVTDVNDCNGGLDINTLNQQCSCPASGSIVLSGADPVCPGVSSSLDATFSTTVGVGPFNLTVTRPISGDTVINNATSVFTLPIDEVGAYSATVEDVGNGCTVSLTGSVSLSNHTLPTATISGGGSICDDGATTTPLTITFTGSGPFNVDLDTTGGTHTSFVGVNSPHVVNAMADQTYTISNLSDANCTGTSATGSAVVSYLDDVIATTGLECDDINPALATDEFQIRVTITQGDLPSAAISELTAHGVTFTDQGGGVWLSSAVNEANSVDINVTDVNDCNGGLNLTSLQRQCTCPTSASIAITGADPICPGGASALDVTWVDGGVSTTYDIQINTPTGPQNFNNVVSPYNFAISDSGTYSAVVTDNGDACDANTSNVSLSFHAEPSASISGTNTICDDGVSTTPLTITFTGASTFNVDLDTTGGTHTSLVGVTSPHVINVSAGGTYVLGNLSDANCPSTNVSGSAIVTAEQQPGPAEINFGDTTVCEGTTLNINATNPTTGTGTWTYTGTGTIGNASNISTSITGITSPGGTLTWTVSSGGTCADVDSSVVVTVVGSSAVTLSIDAHTNPICLGDAINFTTTASGLAGTESYRWYVNGVVDASATSSNYSPPFAIGGTYSAAVTSALACPTNPTDSANTTLTVVNAPNPSIVGGNISTCEDTPVTLTANSSGGTITWLQNGTPVGTGTTYVIDDAGDAGSYTVSEDNGTCPPVVSATGITVNVDAIPTVNAGGDQTVELGSSITLNGSGAGTPVWSPATFLDNVNTLSPISTPTNGNGGSIVYTLTMTNGLCNGSDMMTLWIKQPVRVPNAFSPGNGDGINEVWQLEGIESYPEARLTVFNRWGSPVYKSFGAIIPWDGTNNGEPMPIGTYYYILDLGDGTNPTQGAVTIVR